MKKLPKVSVVIPLWVIEDRFFKDITKFDSLNYPSVEILVICDKKVKLPKIKNFDLKLVLTKKRRTGPAEKRDIGLKKAKGEILAFIDDDAYPDKNWLKNSIEHFAHSKIAAVGGPGLTPKEDNYWERLTGLVYGSFFCGGLAQYRFVKGKMQFVDDYPAYNLLVKKKVLKEVGGYGNDFYGGEDTFLCLKIVKRGYKILYDPELVVYHHRRALFKPYLKQIANIGQHRGFFAKTYPDTSLRPMYFLPTLLTLGLVVLAISGIVFKGVRIYLFSILSFFVLLGIASVWKNKKSIVDAFIAAIGIILTHVVYGIYFILGLLSQRKHIR